MTSVPAWVYIKPALILFSLPVPYHLGAMWQSKWTVGVKRAAWALCFLWLLLQGWSHSCQQHLSFPPDFFFLPLFKGNIQLNIPSPLSDSEKVCHWLLVWIQKCFLGHGIVICYDIHVYLSGLDLKESSVSFVQVPLPPDPNICRVLMCSSWTSSLHLKLSILHEQQRY